MSSVRDHAGREPCAAFRPEPPHSPHQRDVTLHPPPYVPLDAEHERQALEVLADMLATTSSRSTIRRPRGPGYALTYPPHRALLDTPRRQEHAVDPDDRIDVLQEAIDYLARAGELLRPLGDPFLGAYVTRQPEDHSRRSTWPNELTAHSSCSSVIPTVSTRSRRTRPPPGGALSGTSQATPHGAGSRWAAGLSHAAVTRHQTRPKAPTPRRETQLNHPNARSCR